MDVIFSVVMRRLKWETRNMVMNLLNDLLRDVIMYIGMFTPLLQNWCWIQRFDGNYSDSFIADSMILTNCLSAHTNVRNVKIKGVRVFNWGKSENSFDLVLTLLMYFDNYQNLQSNLPLHQPIYC